MGESERMETGSGGGPYIYNQFDSPLDLILYRAPTWAVLARGLR